MGAAGATQVNENTSLEGLSESRARTIYQAATRLGTAGTCFLKRGLCANAALAGRTA